MVVRSAGFFTVTGFLTQLLLINPASALTEYSIEKELEEFNQDPKSFMTDHERVKKYVQHYAIDPELGISLQLDYEAPVTTYTGPFSAASIENRSFLDQKNAFHKSEGFRPGRAAYLPNDNPEFLVPDMKFKTLEQMDSRGLKTGQVEESPWSSDYWPLFSGSIAKRYADPNFPKSRNWAENYSYVFSTLDSCSTENLSPAEKYDLLVNDPKKSLTNAMFNLGKQYFDLNGSVEYWMGICDGWSAASYQEKRPQHKIEVRSGDGNSKIPFYPSDIKALSTLLWTKANYNTITVGSRCRQKNPATDENGRIIDAECFDTNPGTWHLIVVNRIGAQKRSFILDSSFDYEVWNQPAFSYEYTYFNPQSRKEASTIKDAQVKLADFSEDKFKKYRSEKATSVVGIAMKLTYIAETNPTHDDEDSSEFDRKVAVRYLYDLELDENGVIIGGEWYHQQHPDFLWAPEDDAEALSVGDQYLARSKDSSVWRNREKNPVPLSWQKVAVNSSSHGQPLGRIVKELIHKSHQKVFEVMGHSIRVNHFRKRF